MYSPQNYAEWECFLGMTSDNAQAICDRLLHGLETCDALIVTGGVSVGDYDLTLQGMERAGVKILFHGTAIKPGMACAYGVKDSKLICALSGNPASALTNFHVVAAPALRKLCGYSEALWLPELFPVKLHGSFPKQSRFTRFLRGRLCLTGGTIGIRPALEQGNVVLSACINVDMMAIVPAGSGPLKEGTVLQGFLI